MRAGRTVLALTALLALTACAGDEKPNLMNLRSEGADEFGILPTKPLEMPQDYAALPAPTPGGVNITDPTPEADAIVALGGRPDAAGAGVPAADAGIVSATSRFGRTEAIRGTLAAEDLKWRQEHNGRLLERIFGMNRYYKAYSNQSLDQTEELERWRARGVRTVTAPPAALETK
ncbi:DUF3035 domain-containing protein [Frigidibacter sp. MR17.14]